MASCTARRESGTGEASCPIAGPSTATSTPYSPTTPVCVKRPHGPACRSTRPGFCAQIKPPLSFEVVPLVVRESRDPSLASPREAHRCPRHYCDHPSRSARRSPVSRLRDRCSTRLPVGWGQRVHADNDTAGRQGRALGPRLRHAYDGVFRTVPPTRVRWLIREASRSDAGRQCVAACERSQLFRGAQAECRDHGEAGVMPLRPQGRAPRPVGGPAGSVLRSA